MPTDYEDKYHSTEVLGDELVVNGDFNGNANGWTLGEAWSYQSGHLVFDPEAEDGLLATQDIGAEAGESYRVEFELTGSTGSARVWIGGDQDTNETIPFDTANPSVVLLAGSQDSILYFTGVDDFDGTIDNISVKQILNTDIYSDKYQDRETEYDDTYQSS